MHFDSDFENIRVFSKLFHLQPKKDELKVFNFDSDYEITFSLVNSNPEVFGLDWNIKYLVESRHLGKAS